MKKNTFERIKKQIYSQTREKVDKFNIKTDGVVIHQDPALNSIEHQINIQYDKVSYYKQRNINTYLIDENFSGDSYNVSRTKQDSVLGNIQLYPNQYLNILLSVNLFTNRKKDLSFDIKVRDCNVTVFVDDTIYARINSDYGADKTTVRFPSYKDTLLRIYVYAKTTTASFQISGDLGKQIDQYSGTDITPFTIPVVWDSTTPLERGTIKDGSTVKPYVKLKFELDDTDYKDQSIGGFGIYTIDFSKSAGSIIEVDSSYIRVDGRYFIDKYIKVNGSVYTVSEYDYEYYDPTLSITTKIFLSDTSSLSTGDGVYIGTIKHKVDYDAGGDLLNTSSFEYYDYDVKFDETYYYLLNTYDDSINKNRSELTEYKSIAQYTTDPPTQLLPEDINLTKEGIIAHFKIDEDYNEVDYLDHYEWWVRTTNTFPTNGSGDDAKPDGIGYNFDFTGQAGTTYYVWCAAVSVTNTYSNNYKTSLMSFTLSGVGYDHVEPNSIETDQLINTSGWDGNVAGIYQDSEPTSGMKFGDIWIDTDGSWLGSKNIGEHIKYTCDPFAHEPVYFYKTTAGIYHNGKTYFIWKSGSDTTTGNSKPYDENNYGVVFDHSTGTWSASSAATYYVSNYNFEDFTVDQSEYSVGSNSTNYTSDFSGGTDGWVPKNGYRYGNTDGIGGEDDTLKFVVNTTSNVVHYATKSLYSSGINDGDKIHYKIKVYIPSGNTDVDGVKLDNFHQIISGTYSTSGVTDTWVQLDCIGTYNSSGLYIHVVPTKGGADTFTGNGTDAIYIKYVEVRKVGVLADWIFDDTYHSNVLEDTTGNGHTLTASSGFDVSTKLTADSPLYKDGHGLVFDGTDDALSESSTNNNGVYIDNQFSFSVVFQTSDTSTYHPLFTYMDSSTSKGYSLYLNGGKIYMDVGDGSTNYSHSFGTNDLRDGNTHTIVVTYDADSTTFTVYEDQTSIGTWNTGVNISGGTNNLEIGHSYLGYYNGIIYEESFFNYLLTAKEAKEISHKAKYWTWDGNGSISRGTFQQVVSGGGKVSQTTSSLNSSEEYTLDVNGSDSIITGVTSYTIELGDGTYNKSYVKDVYPVTIGPEKTGSDYHHAASMLVANDGHILVTYDPLSDDGDSHNRGAFIRRSTNAYDLRLLYDIGYIQMSGSDMGGAYPQLARGSGNNVFVFAMGQGNGLPQNYLRMARSSDNGVTWTDGYDFFQGETSTTYWTYYRVLAHEPGGWVRIGVQLQDHSSYHFIKLFILKTKDGITWYNEQETFSKNVVTSGYITKAEADSYFIMQNTEDQFRYTYTIESSAVDKNDNFYCVVTRYDYNTGARTARFYKIDSGGNWWSDWIDAVTNATHSSLVAFDNGYFGLVAISDSYKKLKYFINRNSGKNIGWEYVTTIIDFTNEDYTLSYIQDNVHKRSQDIWTVLVGADKRDSSNNSLGYRDFYIVPIDKSKGPLTSDIYRYEDSNGANNGTLSWYAEPDSSIGNNYLNAYTAQSTADEKNVTFFQPTIPTSKSIGDIWIDTDDNNKRYIAASAGCYTIGTGNWELAGDRTVIDENGFINMVDAPDGEGLYIGTNHLGYYSGSAWKTYMANNGDFYLDGTNGYLQWISGTEELEIKGKIHIIGDSTFDGNITSTATITGGELRSASLYLSSDSNELVVGTVNTDQHSSLRIYAETDTGISNYSEALIDLRVYKISQIYNYSKTLSLFKVESTQVLSGGNYFTNYANIYINSIVEYPNGAGSDPDPTEWTTTIYKDSDGLNIIGGQHPSDSRLGSLTIKFDYFKPLTNNYTDIGTSSFRWKTFYINNIDIDGNIYPTTNDTGSVGTSSYKFNDGYFTNLHVDNLSVTGLDADTLDGHDSTDFVLTTDYEDLDVLNKIKNVDGSGSGLDADLLDGHNSSDFVLTTDYEDQDVLDKIKNVDGPGSGLNADLLDGNEASDFVKKSGSEMTGDLTVDTRIRVGYTGSPSSNIVLDVLYDSSSDYGISIKNYNTSATSSLIIYSDNLLSTFEIGVNNSAATTDALDAYIWQYQQKDIKFGTNSTERMRIKSDGDININNNIINKDIIKPVISVDNSSTSTPVITVIIEDMNSSSSNTRIGSSVRGAIHWYISDSQFGDMLTSNPPFYSSTTVNNGNNVSPSSPNLTNLNYALTDSSGIFKITLNTNGTTDTTNTYYFHCEINGYLYSGSFTLNVGDPG